MAIGDVTNNGTSNTDYVTSIAARTAAQGTGPFRNGSSSDSSYADFDQSYDPINGYDSTNGLGSYVVQAGDTLQSIARQLWGDANLWYLIAQALFGRL
jgi:nucleoid-associated protein YgaU